jgi:serine/threonine protein kinase
MLWNEEKQEYCKYRNNPGHGDVSRAKESLGSDVDVRISPSSDSFVLASLQWRAPEEYFDHPLDEKIDIFSLGNNLYSTLTGLSPFYESCYHTSEVQEKVKKGEKPYIDPRWRNNSFAEGRIVELIERCFEYKPEDRIDIFEAVRFLRDAVAENERRKKGQQQ